MPFRIVRDCVSRRTANRCALTGPDKFRSRSSPSASASSRRPTRRATSASIRSAARPASVSAIRRFPPKRAPVENSDIVKGYEYAKGQYVTIEPEEIEHLRLPTRKAIEVAQFVDAKEINPEFFEKPYFVAPSDDIQSEAFAVVRKALQDTGKVALGKISFSGREHIVASRTLSRRRLPGMMAYLLRYSDELRKPADFFGNIKKSNVDEDQLSLAEMLIKRKTAKFDPSKFKDQYEAALRELVEAKVQQRAYSAGRARAQDGQGHQSYGRAAQEHRRRPEACRQEAVSIDAC